MNKHRLEQQAAGDGGAGGNGGGANGAANNGGGGNQAPWFGEFKADAAPDFKEWVTNKNFADPQTALYSAFNQEKLIGADKAGRTLILPKDDKDTAGITAMRAKLGVPEKPEGYELKPASGDEDAELVANASKWFHARGIPKAAAAGLMEDLRKYGAEIRTKAENDAKAAGDAELKALDAEWGTAAAANKELAKRFVRELGIQEADMNAIESVLGTAKFMKMFHAGGTKLGEHKAANSDGGGNNFGYTKEQAREKLEEARTKRSKGEISDADWFETMNKLSPIANAA